MSFSQIIEMEFSHCSENYPVEFTEKRLIVVNGIRTQGLRELSGKQGRTPWVCCEHQGLSRLGNWKERVFSENEL